VRGERGLNLKCQIKNEIDLRGKTENQLAEDRSKGEIRKIGEEGGRNMACRQTPLRQNSHGSLANLCWNFRCLMKMKKRKAKRAMVARCRQVTRLK
jgi:hypothetical protein